MVGGEEVGYTMIPKIYFELTDTKALQPRRHHPGDAGWDLYSTRNSVVPPGDFQDVNTHIHVALPDGYWGRITGRSSTLRFRKLLVIEGVIDTGYRGELFVGVYNVTDRAIKIHAGERLAQLLIHETPKVAWVETESLPDSARGAYGFGSTGR